MTPRTWVSHGRIGYGLVAGSALWVIAAAVASSGCSRAYYRQQADDDAYSLVRQKAHDPRWPLVDYTIDVSPESRMFDPFDPDRPPMPQDDPTSHELMHCVDCKKGYCRWHAAGDRYDIDGPNWRASLPVDEDGVVVLDLDGAMRVALLHSTDFQEELEELYLSALDVSFERFRFDVQFFGGEGALFTSDGPLRTGASSSELDVSTRGVSGQKLFAGGAELVVGLANSFVWEFSGPNRNTATTLVDFTLVQPLLRGAGRDVVLERLTISERSLLANVRQMERFRRGFYGEIVAGRDSGPGPSRRGGFFGGAGLEGFSGVGGGGFGGIGRASFGGGGGTGGGAGAAQAGGYLGLLQNQQEIRNQLASVHSLRDSLRRLEAAAEAPNLTSSEAVALNFQVELARQALHTAESQLMTARTNYQSRLENFVVDLGLPPDLNVRIEDPLLKPFELLDDELGMMQGESDEALVRLQPSPAAAASSRENLVQLVDELGRYQKVLRAAKSLQRRSGEEFQGVAEAMQNLGSNAEKRRRSLRKLAEQTKLSTPGEVPQFLSVEQFDRTLERLGQRFAALEQLVRSSPGKLDATIANIGAELADAQKELAALEGDGPEDVQPLVARRARLFGIAAAQVQSVAEAISEMWLLQANARLESIVLDPIRLDPEVALQIAACNRRDWMNSRAALVDSWRLIQFNADALESDLDIVFSGDVINRDDNPVKLDAMTGRLRAGIQFDAPLTRLAERNNYRQALIEYQQARRSYYELVDRINQSLRLTLRTIELNQVNFELRRAAVHVALAQVDLAREQLAAPLQAGQTSPQPGQVGRDLVSALADLVSVQNDFLSVWLNYRVQQIALDFDLGTMQLDARGLWIEPASYDFAPEENDPGAVEDIPPALLDSAAGAAALRDDAPKPPMEDLAESTSVRQADHWRSRNAEPETARRVGPPGVGESGVSSVSGEPGEPGEPPLPRAKSSAATSSARGL